MSQEPGEPSPFDPFSALRGMRDAYMDTWSKTMIDAVNSDAYAEAMGALLDSYVTVSAPFRQAIEKIMTQVLTQLNMPTRTDVTNIAERLTNVELRLDDLDAKIDTLQRSVSASGGATTRPARSKPTPSPSPSTEEE